MPGAPPALIPLVVDHLRAAGAGEPDPTPEAGAGPRAAGPRPARSAGARPRASDPSAALVVRAAIAASVQRLLAHDPVVRLDAGDVGVHQARVSTRRLRSDLQDLRARWSSRRGPTSLRADLSSWPTPSAGCATPTCSASASRQAAGELDRADAPHAMRLVRRLGRQRAAAQAELIELPRLRRVPHPARPPGRGRPVAPADRGGRRPGRQGAARAGRGAVAQAPPRRRAPRPRPRRRRAPRRPHPGQAGPLRRRGGRPALPAAAPTPTAIADLQGVLGDQHDAVVAEEWLRGAVTAGTSRQQAFVAGLLVAAERERRRRRAAGSGGQAWEAASAKKLTGWLRS